MDSKCIICGDTIPEGRIVCPSCEADPYMKFKSEKKMTKRKNFFLALLNKIKDKVSV